MPGFGKRIDGVSGRRSARREQVAIQAAMFGVGNSQPVVLLDVSSTGAKLQGKDLPGKGSEIWIRGDGIDALATVAWARRDCCGAAFDEPLSELHVRILRQDAVSAKIARLTPEEKIAAEDWIAGLAR